MKTQTIAIIGAGFCGSTLAVRLLCNTSAARQKIWQADALSNAGTASRYSPIDSGLAMLNVVLDLRDEGGEGKNT
ncbi:FAD/NAD(P)-binding protein [Pseudomonas grimontii]|uniref:FAD/NAD(P)-binding protein n=1 Tax=Pseudomonas grimontii TaxID=129847 RepID=UPI002167751F|nr:FAD/NAD(P)-binding protein [Pseudomonas grimontii]MCS3513542.1 putative NAD(P)/FAD-binding protein YdhS [Pseudomonas grimontii]